MGKYLINSDIHPHRFGKSWQHNADALHAFAQFGVDQNVDEWIINGDLDEELHLEIPNAIDRDLYLFECEIVTRAFKLFHNQTGKPISVIRGNHDHPILAPALRRRFSFPGARGVRFDVKPNLIYQPEQDLVITHGHLLDNVEAMREIILNLFRDHVTPAEAIDRIHAAEREIERSYRAKDRKKERVIVERMKLLKILDLEEWMDGMAPWIIGIQKNREQMDHEKRRGKKYKGEKNGVLTHMTDTASYLCAVLGAKVISIGHDHVAGLARRVVSVPDADREEKIVVANSGAFVGKDIPRTGVLVDTDVGTVDVLQFNGTRLAMYRDSMGYPQSLAL